MGTDATLPVRLLPDAKAFIGVDSHPFLSHRYFYGYEKTIEYIDGTIGGISSKGFRFSSGLGSERFCAVTAPRPKTACDPCAIS